MFVDWWIWWIVELSRWKEGRKEGGGRKGEEGRDERGMERRGEESGR